MSKDSKSGSGRKSAHLAEAVRTVETSQGPIEIVPVSDALGAEIRGVDLSGSLASDLIAAIQAAWAEHEVLLFRGQDLREAQHVAFSRAMGPVQRPNATSMTPLGHSEILLVSNLGPDGEPTKLGLGNAEALWHTDMSYLEKPPAGSALYSREIPPSGGNTCFCSMTRAYETLPAHLLQRIAGRHTIHDSSRNSTGKLRPGFEVENDPRKTPGAHHPIVRTHPVSGRKALFLGRRAFSYVVDMEVGESEALLDELWAHATREALAWCHQWRVGDLVLWDNRCVMHRRDPFDESHRRVLHRTQIGGEVPA